jgi:hypothetical protein
MTVVVGLRKRKKPLIRYADGLPSKPFEKFKRFLE